MAELRDEPRPKGYWPGTPTQWREASVDDCTWYAGEAAWESASNNHLSMHPVLDLRNRSIDTVGGTPPLVMMQEMNRLWPTSEDVGWAYGSWTKEELRRALAGGASVLYPGHYAKLPPHYRRWTNNDDFQHMMMSKFLNAQNETFLYDPLGGGPQRDPYDGEWIPFWQLVGEGKYTWQQNAAHWSAGIVQNLEQEAVRNVFATAATRELRVKRGAPVFPKPRALNHDKKLWQDDNWRPWYGTTSNGWRLIAYWKNGEQKFGYVHKMDVLETRDTPAPPPEPAADCEAIRQENLALEQGNLDLTQRLYLARNALAPLADALAE